MYLISCLGSLCRPCRKHSSLDTLDRKSYQPSGLVVCWSRGNTIWSFDLLVIYICRQEHKLTSLEGLELFGAFHLFVSEMFLFSCIYMLGIEGSRIYLYIYHIDVARWRVVYMVDMSGKFVWFHVYIEVVLCLIVWICIYISKQRMSKFAKKRRYIYTRCIW